MIMISVDLIESALNQLEFLEDIENLKIPYSKKIIKRAVYRYEKFWLPFCIKHDNYREYYPPLDVAWIWHCHMLSPTSYFSDCKNFVGTLIDHDCNNRKDRKIKQQKTTSTWSNTFNASYEYLKNNSIGDKRAFESFESKIEYDLCEASERQKSFYYQVSLEHYKNKDFLAIGLERYKKFLYLKKLNPDAYVVPCYAIDIIWHSHQLNPKAYYNDTKSVLGKIFPHDDTINDRSPDSKLSVSNEKTRELWKNTYKENFNLNGKLFQ